jgi:hypothetical protein
MSNKRERWTLERGDTTGPAHPGIVEAATLQASNRSPLTRQSQPSPLPARTKTSPAGPERQPERHLGFIAEQGGAGRRRRAARCRRAGWRPPKLRCVRRSEGEHAISHSHALNFLVSRGIFAEGFVSSRRTSERGRACLARTRGWPSCREQPSLCERGDPSSEDAPRHASSLHATRLRRESRASPED